VPFFCDVFIGETLTWEGDKKRYMQKLDSAMHDLENEEQFALWK